MLGTTSVSGGQIRTDKESNMDLWMVLRGIATLQLQVMQSDSAGASG